jgi:hypothetical protein
MDYISLFINEMYISLGKKIDFFLIITHEFN